MPHAELVEYVRILGGDVDDRHVRIGDVLDHALLDEAGALDLVGADDLDDETSVVEALDGRLDDLVVNPVEVDLVAPRRVRFGVERHDHKARPFVVDCRRGSCVRLRHGGIPLSII